jgi:hypothetical protein
MFEREPTSADLLVLAGALGLDFSTERLEAVLPEVRRIWAQTQQLGALPLDEAPAPGAPGTGPSGP